MADRLITLRYDGTCRACSTPVAATTKAWHDPAAKKITCCTCRPEAVDAPAPQPLPPPRPIERGVAGLSAQQQFDKRRANHERRNGLQPGSEGADPLTAALPQHTKAWLTGAIGEELLGAYLDFQVGANAYVLHDLEVPDTRGSIDHIVVAASGVWIVRAERLTGEVEERDYGGWFQSDIRLYVDGRNHTRLIANMNEQFQPVRQHLARSGFGETPIHRALCFTDTTWQSNARPFTIRDVLITWPEALADKIRQAGPVPADLRMAVATELGSRLPASA